MHSFMDIFVTTRITILDFPSIEEAQNIPMKSTPSNIYDEYSYYWSHPDENFLKTGCLPGQENKVTSISMD